MEKNRNNNNSNNNYTKYSTCLSTMEKVVANGEKMSLHWRQWKQWLLNRREQMEQSEWRERERESGDVFTAQLFGTNNIL